VRPRRDAPAVPKHYYIDDGIRVAAFPPAPTDALTSNPRGVTGKTFYASTLLYERLANKRALTNELYERFEDTDVVGGVVRRGKENGGSKKRRRDDNDDQKRRKRAEDDAEAESEVEPDAQPDIQPEAHPDFRPQV
jgi:hypothetical protein